MGDGGALYLVATPIGNMDDMSDRAREVLASAAIVAAEDTRHTGLLLSRLGIRTRLVSYHEHNEAQRVGEIVDLLGQGKDVAVVSDAGTPGISDPGEVIVREAIRLGYRVVPVPGPAAFVSALVASGLPAGRFFFQGFLPRKTTDRRRALADLASLPVTLIFYEAPHRLEKMLADVYEVLGDRRCAIARELTKKFEEIWRGTVGEAVEWVRSGAVRGEIVVVVEGFTDLPGLSGGPPSCSDEGAEACMSRSGAGSCECAPEDGIARATREAVSLVQSGLPLRDAAARCAHAYGAPRRMIYEGALRAMGKKD